MAENGDSAMIHVLRLNLKGCQRRITSEKICSVYCSNPAVCCLSHQVWRKDIVYEAMKAESYIPCEEVKYYIWRVADMLARLQAWEGNSVI